MAILMPDTSAAAGAELTQAGTWPGTIRSVKPGKSKEKGTAQLEIDLGVTGPSVTDSSVKERNCRVWVQVEGAGSFRFDQLLRACKLDSLADQFKVPGAQVPFDTDILLGQLVDVVIDLPKKGGNFNDVNGFLRSGTAVAGK